MTDDAIPRQSFADKHRKVLLGLLGRRDLPRRLAGGVPVRAVQQAVHLQARPDLRSARRSLASGDLLRDLAISAVPFLYGFSAAVVVGVPLGVVMGWRARRRAIRSIR